MRNISAAKPVTAMSEQAAQREHVVDLGLDPDAVRALHVSAHDRPDHAAEEHQPGGVADEGVRLVRVAVQELEVLGELVVDLEHRGDAEQHQEPEVDHRVHQPGGRVAQQRLHVGAGPVALGALLGVLERRAPLGGTAALPVLHPVGEAERAPRQHHRDHGVEGDLEWRRARRRTPRGGWSSSLCQSVITGTIPESAVNSAMPSPSPIAR